MEQEIGIDIFWVVLQVFAMPWCSARFGGDSQEGLLQRLSAAAMAFEGTIVVASSLCTPGAGNWTLHSWHSSISHYPHLTLTDMGAILENHAKQWHLVVGQNWRILQYCNRWSQNHSKPIRSNSSYPIRSHLSHRQNSSNPLPEIAWAPHVIVVNGVLLVERNHKCGSWSNDFFPWVM